MASRTLQQGQIVFKPVTSQIRPIMRHTIEEAAAGDGP